MKFYYKHLLVGMAFFALALQTQAQTLEVSGIVTGPTGPLSGANVAVKHKAAGTITDIGGKYALTVQPSDTLVFSYTGYTPLTVSVAGRSSINVQLQEDATSLDEVVINAGYYNTTERERTGSISRITAKEIELQALASPLQALQGRMAGVEILPGGNMPGAAPTIRIRGQNSLRAEGNYPLFIIDGVPVNSVPLESFTNIGFAGIDPLSTIDLSNIESIEVLKDADATAIYGSRGANGIVLITTKNGKEQKGVQARLYMGVATVPNKLDLLNTSQYLQIRRKAFENDGVEPDEDNAYDLLLWDQNRYTNWQEYFLGGTSNLTNINVSGTGGNEYTNFRLSGSIFRQGTIYPADMSYRKFTGGAQLHHNSKDQQFNLDLAINYGVNHNELLSNGVNFSRNAFVLPPNAPPLFKEDGSLNWENWGEAGLNNPLEGFFNTATIGTNNLVANLNLSYELFSGLWLKANMGYTRYNGEELVKMPQRSYNPSGQPKHMSLNSNSRRKSWIIEPQVVYKKQWGKLGLEALIGATLQESKDQFSSVEGNGYAAESLIGNLGAAEDLLNAIGRKVDYRYNALFSRMGFNWNKKYYLNFTGRRDGSSRFGPGNRFSNFGAIGAAWIFSEEALFENHVPWLSLGKLRASYGSTGNDQIPDYGYLDAYEATPGPDGLYPTKLANPDYSWEVNKKMEVALRLGLIKNRINLGISWYRNRSSNQLVGFPLPGTTGFNSVQANLGATVENRGWEIELLSENIRKENFQWRTAVNISFPKNELVSYPNIEQSPYKNEYRVGSPLNIALFYRYQGIDPQTGLYTVADINGDENYDYQDRVVVQDLTREYFGGINNTLRYKGFTLQFLWQFVKQKGSFTALFNAGIPENQVSDVLNGLGGQGPYQRASQLYEASLAYGRVANSNFVIEDATYLRLKTFSLSYTLPTKVGQALSIAKCKVFITGQNLITITNYPGMDPAMPIGGTSFGGLRTITGGIELNF